MNADDKKYLIFLFCFSIALTVIMTKFHMGRGAFSSDVSVYLAGALDLADLNVNHISDPVWIQNSPVILFLTSLFFRLGYVNAYAIIYVSAFFGIVGIFGLYTLLRRVFTPLLSLSGSILYSSLSLTLFYYANGMLDVPAVAMLLWTLVFTIAAVDKDPKYYILVAISFSISFFIRFTNAFIFILIILYILKKYDVINLIECLFHDRGAFKSKIISFVKSRELKWMVLAVGVSFSIFMIVFQVLLSHNVQIGYFSFAQGSLGGYHDHVGAAFKPDKWFFVKHFLKLLSCNHIVFGKVFLEKFKQPSFLAYLIMGILASGLILKGINCLKNINFFKNNLEKLEYRNNYSRGILILSMIFLIILARFSFKITYLYAIICFFAVFVILMSLMRELPIDKDKFSFSILCVALFLFYFLVVSFIDIKCVRYILPAFPGFVYLVIYSFDYICEFIRDGFDDNDTLLKKLNKESIASKSDFRIKLSKAVPIIFIIVCLFFAFNFTNTVEVNENGVQIIELCDFIKEYDPDYQSKEIITLWDIRYFEWYLNKDIDKLGEDVDELDPDKYDYVITFEGPYKDDNYRKVHSIGYYYLNERIT
ncbi:glycosyltransferase family 39 protein [Methanobrevibacter sp.]|uniref:glycosyltransferase family 39 protein n=1 Tax=Methanobrevibacter sp. TaxID=66852 RepID=UPI0038693B17